MGPSTSPVAGAANEQPSQQVLETAQQVAQAHAQVREQMQRVIIGQQDVVDLLVLSLLCQGHCLLEGVPGLAKTLMVSSLSELLGLRFGRIQFTPDLMPSDITGTEILEEDHTTGKRAMRFVRGPLFANMVLADEINRTPPKTQAALLQAMQEYQVTAAGVHHELERPFFVLGTQNPIESEGTYPLPEAALDRFMFKVHVGYPDEQEEIDIALSTTRGRRAELEPVLDRDDILGMQAVVREVIVARAVAGYAVRLVRATRPGTKAAPDYVGQYLDWGAGPRACQALLLGAKARALLDGRPHAAIDDIRFVAKPVMRHRLVANFTAESENVSTDDVIDQLLEDLPESG